jgi:antitoxin HicB
LVVGEERKMQTFQYPAQLQPDDDGRGFVVTFPDLPEAITQGEDLPDALEQAADCLEEAVANRIAMKMDIPSPSKAESGQHLIPVPAVTAITAALYNALRESGMSRVELAAHLGVDEKEVRRLLDPYHPSKLPRLEEVLERVGKKLVVSVEDVEELKMTAA